MLMIFSNGLGVSGANKRPEFVNIGAILAFNSTIGKVARVAVQAAIDDVNSDPSILGGTKLRMKMQDTNDSGFLGIIEGICFVLVFLFVACFEQ